jgi:hypothetical protein
VTRGVVEKENEEAMFVLVLDPINTVLQLKSHLIGIPITVAILTDLKVV